MTTIRYFPDEHRMEIKGHAGSAASGRDIVCAGISALTFALLTAATDEPELMTNVYISNDAAEVRVQCYPDEEHDATCREMFKTILAGYANLADTYPEYVTIGGSNG